MRYFGCRLIVFHVYIQLYLPTTSLPCTLTPAMAASKSHAPKRCKILLTLGLEAAKAGLDPRVTWLGLLDGVDAALALVTREDTPDFPEPAEE